MLYIVPALGLTVVMTSDSNTRSADDGYRCQLHALISDGFIPAALKASALPEKPAPADAAMGAYPSIGGNRCLPGAPGTSGGPG